MDIVNYDGKLEFLNKTSELAQDLIFTGYSTIESSEIINKLKKNGKLKSNESLLFYINETIIKHLDMVEDYVNEDKVLKLLMPIYEYIKDLEKINKNCNEEIIRLKKMCELQNTYLEEYKAEFGLSKKEKARLESKRLEEIEMQEMARYAYRDLCEGGAFSDEGIMPEGW